MRPKAPGLLSLCTLFAALIAPIPAACAEAPPMTNEPKTKIPTPATTPPTPAGSPATAAATASLPAPTTPASLAAALERRFAGDRSAACLAAAVVEGAGASGEGVVSRAFVCADPGRARKLDAATALEIGSVTKTMTGMVLAGLVSAGKVGLDDPLERHLPKGTRVPSFQGQPIRLKHLTTHTSGLPGLPARMPTRNLANPYADLSEKDLLRSLGDVTLAVAPGTRWDYSNFGVMVLSYALSRAAKRDYEALLRERLFAPLGMKQAFIVRKPKGVVVAAGHIPGGVATSAWDIPVNLAGVGGVRASLDDMVAYARAALGRGPAEVVAHIRASQQPVDLGRGAAAAPGAEMGMGWAIARVGARQLLLHEGGTGGFSAFLAVEPQAGRAVVLLSDTAVHGLGGLQDTGLYLLGARPDLPPPRKLATPPRELLAALEGRYQLGGGLSMRLFVRDGKLHIHPDGQAEHVMGYDSEGDFFPLDFDARLSPQRSREGQTFVWAQLGGETRATRETAPGQGGAAAPRPAAPPVRTADYLGDYPLLPGFVLTVFDEAGRLFVQATGQSRIEVTPVDKDVFTADSVGAELTFERDDRGQVHAVTLRQKGQRLHAPRRPTASAPPPR
jgi:serine-type D-Ala-D-Ala carboxypeptidase/endopeptidase